MKANINFRRVLYDQCNDADATVKKGVIKFLVADEKKESATYSWSAAPF